MSGSDCLSIRKDTDIIIYGAAGNGIKGYHSLCVLNGYHVLGFIDKRAAEIGSQFGLPVWTPEEIPPMDKSKCLVCVCIRNVFEHEHIVNDLIRQGFSYFVFKPVTSIDREDLAASNRNYERIFGDANSLQLYTLEPVPAITELPVFIFQDRAIIESDEQSVVVNLPLWRVFVNSALWPNGMKDAKMRSSVLALVPQIGLFSYFGGSGGDEEEYLAHCASTIANSQRLYGQGGGTICDTPAWRRSIIENRQSVYEKMNESFELNPGFFIRNAPICALDEDGYLIMNSAKHRAAFFISKRRRFIPLRLSHGDYERFLNGDAADALSDYLKESQIYRLTVPMQHPLFYGFPAKWADYYEAVLYPVVTEIARCVGGSVPVDRLAVCDCFDDMGTLAQALSVIGFQASAVIGEKNRKLAALIGQLYGTDSVRYTDKPCPADIIFCMDQSLEDLGQIHAKLLFVFSEDISPSEMKDYFFRKTVSHTMYGSKSVYIQMYFRREEA